MIGGRTHDRLRPLARRTVVYRDARHGCDALRQIADAAHGDAWGRAVEVRVTTDPSEAPPDCR